MKVIVLGAGESGTGAALLAQAKGYEVFVSDAATIPPTYKQELIDAKIAFEENGHSPNLLNKVSLIIKSPGIPPWVDVIKQARQKGIVILDEIAFAARHTSARLLAITGSNGKTTTTLLTHYILSKSKIKAGLAGNVGKSLARQLLLEDQPDWYVLELSSFQLEEIQQTRFDIAVILNISADHLNRYDNDILKYARAKWHITDGQTPKDHFICSAHDEVLNQLKNEKPVKAKLYNIALKPENNSAACVAGGSLSWLEPNSFKIAIEKMSISGPHNQFNALCAGLAARLAGATPTEIADGLYSFINAAHRMEEVAVIDKVKFVNDSKATNVDAVKQALSSYKNIILIAGGVDKGNDYSLLYSLVNKNVKTIIGLGTDLSPLRKAFTGKVKVYKETASMVEAVQVAHSLSQTGDVVLLSPACASFDLFKNYEDRGNQFKKEVRRLLSVH